MAAVEYGSAVNLASLRGKLAERLALWLMGLSWLGLLYVAFFRGGATTIGLLMALLALGVGVCLLTNAHPTQARYMLAGGLTLSLLAAMWLSPDPWLPFLGLLLVFSGAMLASGSGVVIAAAVAGAAWWLNQSLGRGYPMPDVLVALLLSVVVSWLSVSTLYTALEWTWNMKERANHLLQVVSDQQVELKRTVKSLEQVNALQCRTQQELVWARQRAEEAQHVTEQLAANISHELRTPLSLILGFSEMMQLSPEVYGEMHWPPKLRQAVYQIYRSSRHLMEMIDDILDLSRFDIGGESLDYEPTSLEPLVWDTIRMVESLFFSDRIRLEVQMPDELPALDIDRTRIRQVLLNLLNNARRFTQAGVVRLTVECTDGEVLISVRDTGPGIPADKLSNIFKEFYQVDRSLRRSHSGTGLGLAICKRFVEAHQGRIWVESQEGVGSTFYFTLPIPDQHVSASTSDAIQSVGQSWPELQAPILVVAPDPAAAALLRRHIGKYKVVQVADPEDLDDEIVLHHPRAIIHNTPPDRQHTLTGLVSAPIPVIECSLPSLTWATRNPAVVACLTKPVTVSQLMGEIEPLVGIHDVLVIDDEHGFCQLVERMLETTRSAFRVRYAHNGEDGLQAMRRQRPDLVLLDLILPGVDGFQVLQEMQGEPALADIPVILLTASSFVDDALAQHNSPMVIWRPDGLKLSETLHCLQAVIDTLEPRYDERTAPVESLRQHFT